MKTLIPIPTHCPECGNDYVYDIGFDVYECGRCENNWHYKKEIKEPVKLLIFKSKTTKAIYSWNGKEVITISGSENRPVGEIMNGIPNEILEIAFEAKQEDFKVGGAIYFVLVNYIL